MGQATLDDDELFGEAADELEADVREHLDAAEASLPDPATVWEVDAENVLGVLNTLRTALDPGDAPEHLRQAKKWFALGERADAFEDVEGLENRLERAEETVEMLSDMETEVCSVASTLPQLRDRLDDDPSTQQNSLAAD